MGATKPRNTPLIPASKRTRRLCTYLADAPEFDKSVRLKEEAKGALGAAKMTFEDADKKRTNTNGSNSFARVTSSRIPEDDTWSPVEFAIPATIGDWLERQRITRLVPERGLGVPKLRSNLTTAQKLRVVELDGKWAAAKLEREEVHKKRKAAREAVEEDFLSLPFAEDDGRQGIYANFASGDRRRMDEEYDVYVGSSRHLKQRVAWHLGVAEKFSVTNLPEEHKKSFHYRQICRDGVRQEAFEELKNAFVDMPILAHFDPEKTAVSPPVSPAASPSAQHYVSRHASPTPAASSGQASPPVAASPTPVGSPLAASPGPASSPLAGPLRSDGSLGVLPPLGALPPLSPAAASAEPLPAALPCQRCLMDALHQGRVCSCVRDASYEEVMQFLQLSDLKATRAAGGEIRCDNCGAVENPSKRGHIANSETGKVLCYLCDSLARSRKTRDSGPVQRFKTKKQLKADREAGRPIVCSNCGTIEDPSAPKAKVFLVNQRSG
ncbi:uncharacterized protein Aud_010039 [Aspergillus udagawae]|uniref:GIY-YIG domain-containing protein n=1 Tax=Aspergillus udagawae TaxID=91492 RepID=A0A8E0V4B5_9EURO|nr:uncharacterized protein Aud_010039 [Aspergillus udagawae]GIC93551.1 hypothetical protein Aud_010039 [Aspergillus udagawae]